MALRLEQSTDRLEVTLPAALTISAGAFSLGILFKRLNDPDTFAQVVALADSYAGSVRLGLEFDEDGTTLQARGSGGYGGMTGYATGTEWLWCDLTRSGTTLRLRVHTMDGTKVHDATITHSTSYSTLDTILIGQTGNGLAALNGEVCNFKVVTGVAWSDEESRVEMRHFGIQKTGGTERYAFRLEDTTDTFAGLRAIPVPGQATAALTNTGVVDGASRPTALEPLGVYLRQFAHRQEDANVASTTVAVTFPANVQAGNLLDVNIGHSNTGSPTISGVADGLSNTYTDIPDCRAIDVSHSQTNNVWYAKNITGGACTITATITDSVPYRSIIATEWGGLDTSAPLDGKDGDALVGTAPQLTVVPTTPGQLCLVTFKDSLSSDIGTVTWQAGTQPIGPLTVSDATSQVDQVAAFYIRRVAHTYTEGITIPASRTVLTALRSYKAAVDYGMHDTFDRTNENPLSDGGEWAPLNGGLGNLKTVNSVEAVGVNNVQDGAMRRTGATTLNDQWAAGVMGGDLDCALLLRADGSGNAYGFVSLLSRWFRFTAGSWTSLQSDGSTWTAGDEMYAEVFGASPSTLAVWKNGVLWNAFADSTGPQSGGVPGGFVYSNGDRGILRSWAGGGLWEQLGGSGGGTTEVWSSILEWRAPSIGGTTSLAPGNFRGEFKS